MFQVLSDMQRELVPVNKKIAAMIAKMDENEPVLSEEGKERVKWLKKNFKEDQKELPSDDE